MRLVLVSDTFLLSVSPVYLCLNYYISMMTRRISEDL